MVKKENSQIQFNKCSSGELPVPPAWQTRPYLLEMKAGCVNNYQTHAG